MAETMSMTKEQLIQALTEAKVQFPSTATIQQMRSLYAEEKKKGTVFNVPTQSSVSTPSSQNDANVTIDGEMVANDTSVSASNANANEASGLTVPAATIQSNDKSFETDLLNDEAAIDAEIRLLEKQKRLAELRRELSSETQSVHHKIDFNDIKHSVIPFSNSEEYDAHKWIKDFERACDTVNSDESFRLKSIRRLMKADSEGVLFLRIDNSSTYQQFRANFLANFGHQYTISDVINKLKSTTFALAKTSVMGYILKMQEIASRANFRQFSSLLKDFKIVPQTLPCCIRHKNWLI